MTARSSAICSSSASVGRLAGRARRRPRRASRSRPGGARACARPPRPPSRPRRTGSPSPSALLESQPSRSVSRNRPGIYVVAAGSPAHSGGRRSAQGRACSSWAATRSSTSSRPCGATSWTPDRQPVVGPVQRQRDRGVAGGVEERVEDRRLAGALDRVQRIAAGVVEGAERRRGLARGRGQQQVVALLEPAADQPGEPLVERRRRSGTRRAFLRRPSSASAQVSGSTSSGPSSRPSSMPNWSSERGLARLPAGHERLDHVERAARLGRGHPRSVLVDRVPELLEQRGGRARRRLHAVGSTSLVDERLHSQPDPQLAGVGADLLGVGALGRRREVGIAGRRPVDGLEDRGGVADRARTRPAPRSAPRVRRRSAGPARCAGGSASARPGRCGWPGSGSSRRRRWHARPGRSRRRPRPPEPPLEPPGVCSRFQGLRVAP